MTHLRQLWRSLVAGWMRFAHILGIINTTLLLTIVFALIVVPMRLIWGLLRKDPLRLRRDTSGTMWIPRTPEPPTLDERRHPF